VGTEDALTLALLALAIVVVIYQALELTARRETIARHEEQKIALEASNGELRARLVSAERVAGLVVDQLGAKADLLHQPTFAPPAASRGAGALPRLFATIGRNALTPEPGLDTRERVTGNGIPG
jgi:hypothetical protein